MALQWYGRYSELHAKEISEAKKNYSPKKKYAHMARGLAMAHELVRDPALAEWKVRRFLPLVGVVKQR